MSNSKLKREIREQIKGMAVDGLKNQDLENLLGSNLLARVQDNDDDLMAYAEAYQKQIAGLIKSMWKDNKMAFDLMNLTKKRKVPGPGVPLRSFRELADGFGVSIKALTGYFSSYDGPKPTHKTRNDKWYVYSEAKSWWAELVAKGLVKGHSK